MQVTMLSDQPLKKPNPKITYLKHGILDRPEFENYREENFNIFEVFKNEKAMYAAQQRYLLNVAKIIYDDPIVDSLYRRLDEFDLLIFDSLYNEVSLALLSIYIVIKLNKSFDWIQIFC